MRRLPWLRTGIIQRLRLEPGDKLVITFQRRLNPADVDHVLAIVRERWHIDTAVNPVGILDDGATLTVVSQPPVCDRPSCYDGTNTVTSRIEHGCVPDWTRP